MSMDLGTVAGKRASTAIKVVEAAVIDGKRARAMTCGGAWRPAGRPHALAMMAAATMLAATLAGQPVMAADTLYKWTDEQGVVHYTDKMPPDMVNRGNLELSKQGMPGKKTEPMGTLEQQQARAAEAARQRVLAKEKEELARQDRAVLDSYTTESDIDLARNRALKTIDSALQSAQSYTEQLTKRKAAMVEKNIEPTDKAGLAGRERDLARIDADLAAQNAFVTQKQKEIVATNAKYDSDKARWKAALIRKRYLESPPTPTAANTAAPVAADKTTKK